MRCVSLFTLVPGWRFCRFISLLVLCLLSPIVSQGQICQDGQYGDANYVPPPFTPAYLKGSGPKVLFDEAHHNFHTISPLLSGKAGRAYAFGELVQADGFRVAINRTAITSEALADYDILVISGAGPAPFVVCKEDSGSYFPSYSSSGPAFTSAEVAAIQNWVWRGGALLLAADHVPFGLNVENLARAFGIRTSNGVAIDSVLNDEFTRSNGGLSSDYLHPILRGRNPQEAISTVRTFGGSTLQGPWYSTKLLRFSDEAVLVEMDIEAWVALYQILSFVGDPNAAGFLEVLYALSLMDEHSLAFSSAASQSQGMALPFGRGRVVVLAEQAMLTKQVTANGEIGGLVVHGNDLGNTQFVLNVMRWLAGS